MTTSEGGPLTFDFDAGVGIKQAEDVARAALDDDGYRLLPHMNTTSRIVLVRMKDEAGRLIDRLVVPGWMVSHK